MTSPAAQPPLKSNLLCQAPSLAWRRLRGGFGFSSSFPSRLGRTPPSALAGPLFDITHGLINQL
jgi:hypothetical protein